MGIPDGEDLQAHIRQWRQGDFVLGSQAVVWGYHPDRPLTDTSAELADEAETILGVALASGEVEGLVVISQTCDIIRPFPERPYVQVAPLKRMADASAELAVRRRNQPRYAFLPALGGTGLVVDLDRIFTVEKAMLAHWERQAGCLDDDQRRSLTETIRRYYGRPALPDPFTKAIDNLRGWFKEKHNAGPPPAPRGKPAPLHVGACLQGLEMTLARPSPSWLADQIHVDFLLIRSSLEDGIFEGHWEDFRIACKDKVALPPNFTMEWQVIPFADLPARLYLESDHLDLDYLSDSTRM